MTPLVIVSNRTPGEQTAAGGLAVALKKVLAERDGFWFGWSGEFSDSPADTAKFQDIDGLSVGTIDLTKADYHGYYEGYANSVLWPVFHHRLDLAHIEPEHFEAYMRVNRSIAHALVQEIGPDHTIWVHDYHLIPLARELRRLGAKNKIGFFLHIPLPGPEMFSAIPHYGDLLESLAAYDTVGLQAQRDVEKLREQFDMEGLPSVTDRSQGDSGTHPDSVDAFPIGTDPEAFKRLLEKPNAQRTAHLVDNAVAGRQLILGVDRLDYSKGLPERIAAYERLLEVHPEWHREVHMLQIAPVSRDSISEYQDINDQMDIACGRVMGRFSEPDWIPINYVKRAYPQSALAGLYRLAKVALVTPLRDGMNLVAHEFITCQDSEDPGVLVLSRFAGAAELFPEALLVNPHHVDETAQALNTALKMPLDERIERWQALMSTVETHSVDAWASSFLKRLSDAAPWESRKGAASATKLTDFPLDAAE